MHAEPRISQWLYITVPGYTWLYLVVPGCTWLYLGPFQITIAWYL